MRRWDHRSRFPVRTHNDAIKAIQECNRVMTSFGSGGDSLTIWAKLTHSDRHLLSQLLWQPGVGAYGIKRGELPHRTVTGADLWAMHQRANDLRWLGRGGYPTPGRAWGYGWDGYNASATTDSDLLLLGSSYPLTGAAGNLGGCYLDDPMASTSYPTNPTIPANQQIGGTGAPAWTSWATSDLDVFSGGAKIYSAWGDSPGNQTNAAWTFGHTDGEGIFEQYPVTLDSPHIYDPNYCGMMVSPSGTPLSTSYFVGGSVPVSFPGLLQRVPDGTTILSAKVEVKCAGAVKHDFTWTTTVDSNGTPTTEFDDTETTGGIAFALLGRRVETSGGVRRLAWDVLSTSVGGTVSGGVWQIADVTALCQDFVDRLRRGVWNEFALMPTIASAHVGEIDMRGFMQSLLPTQTWAYWLDPNYSGDVYGGIDTWYRSHCTGSILRWDSLELGQIIVEIQYPGTENRKAICYGNTCRMDSPA